MTSIKQIESLIERAKDNDLALEIQYVSNSSGLSTRIISEITDSDEYGDDYISAYCHNRCEQRTFKISRIMSARIISPETKKDSRPTPRTTPTSNSTDQRNNVYNLPKTIFRLYGETY